MAKKKKSTTTSRRNSVKIPKLKNLPIGSVKVEHPFWEEVTLFSHPIQSLTALGSIIGNATISCAQFAMKHLLLIAIIFVAFLFY